MAGRVGYLQRLVLLVVYGGFCGLCLPDVHASGLSSLSGYVYVDRDFDGLRDPAVEWVLPDIELLLTRLGDPVGPRTAVTGADGYYEFSGLGAGTYRIVQPAIPGGYLSVKVGVGQLLDVVPGDSANAFPGYVVNYDQRTGTPPQIAGIELPGGATRGVNYDFGQIWTGKAWYLAGGGSNSPPGADPPLSIPEPSTVILAAIGALLCIGQAAACRPRRVRVWTATAGRFQWEPCTAIPSLKAQKSPSTV